MSGGKEVAMVTSAILPQLKQDAHLHLDEAIVTTTLLP